MRFDSTIGALGTVATLIGICITGVLWIDNNFDDVRSEIAVNERAFSESQQSVKNEIAILRGNVGYVDEKKINNNISKNNVMISDIERELSDLKRSIDRISDLEAAVEIMQTQSRNPSNQASVVAKDNGEIAELQQRISSLEEKMKSLASNRPNASGKIEIQSDYQGQFETKASGDFDISLVGCNKNGSRANCSFLFKNNDNRDRSNSLSAVRTRAILPSALPVNAKRVIIGQRSDNGQLGYDFPSKIPTKVELQFENLERDLPGFLLLQLAVGTGKVEFKNVALTQ